MNISVASDHGGVDFKAALREKLESLGHSVQDFGTDSKESCDYPDYGLPAVHAVQEGKADRGILVCTNGLGMSMLANKCSGIRAALVYSEKTAEVTRRHHNSNVLCLGAQEFSEQELLSWVELWLKTPFDAGRHERRISKFPEV